MTVTVKGWVPDGDLGVVAIHEYILHGLPGWENDPWADFDRPKAFDGIVAALLDFKRAGGATMVESGGTLGGRDPEMLANLSSASGVNIVASSGFGSESAIPGYFLLPLAGKAARAKVQESGGETPWIPDAQYIAELILSELTGGMAASGMNRSKVRAGIVTAASTWDGTREIEELAIRGAAIAARKSGAAVFTDGVKQALRQFELMTKEGLAPARIVIGHCDDGRAVDPARDREFAEKGAYIAYDHIGWEDAGAPHAMPDERRAALVKEMVSAGFAGRLVLSCSAIGHGLGMPGSKRRYAYLLKDFVPRLRKEGIGEEAIQTMLVENPRRILSAVG